MVAAARHVRDAEPDRPELWLPERPMRHHYLYGRTRYLTAPGVLERLAELHREVASRKAVGVRLMHSMVRYHLLASGRWDVATYGIPIPQVDQMPAGTIGTFFMSARVLAKGRTEFTEAERATVELARYRCFLLGLPEDLLGDTPQEIVDLLTARHITLREGYDDEICGSLVRGTMEVELFDRRLNARLAHLLDSYGHADFVTDPEKYHVDLA